MRLFYPKEHYDKKHRGSVFPLLKAFIKSSKFTDAERVEMYHVSDNDFSIIDTLEKSDVAVLTMSWNYYVNKNKENSAVSFVKKCEIAGKKVLIWNAGDYGVKIPKFKNAIIFRESGYRSKFSKNEHTLPSFIKDPLKTYYQISAPIELPKTRKPVLGFCGQARSSKTKALKELGLISLRNMKYYLGLSKNEPQELLPSSYLRGRILDYCEQSVKIETNFIRRKKYRAGVTSQKEMHPTTIEFYDNLKNSAYIICVRGGGNFSVRFYEALAMGRIPVFVDTHSSVPFYDIIPWKNHVVWVKYKDRKNVAQKIYDFHQNLSESDFIQLQWNNRKLWEDKLTLGAFFSDVLKVEKFHMR